MAMPADQVIRHRFHDDDDDIDADYPDEYQMLGEEPVQMEKDFASCIIVDNLPVVGKDKYEKLHNVVSKIYTQIPGGKVVQIYMPEDVKGATMGFAFIEFSTPEAAKNAVAQTNGYKLDRAHIFKVNMYDDFQIYEKVAENFDSIEMPPYKPKENLWWWLTEGEGSRDQYVVRYADQTEVFWNDGKKKPESNYKKKDMTETYVTWSPFGTYLGTLHRQGIILWGTNKWEKIMRFQHPGVKLLDFSPKENYLVTVSPQFQANDNPKDPQAIIVWDVHTGLKKRGFQATKEGTWPAFKWSHDEKYFARLSEDAISIYETPSMQMLDKKSLKIEGVKDFQWSPSDNIIACWVPEQGNKPARVMLIEIPSRNVIRSHNLFKVKDCNLHWQSSGDYLCVKVDRIAGKKTTFTAFELYRMRQKDIPIETIEIKENVVAFSWEPKGNRFAIIHNSTPARNDVSFYSMKDSRNKLGLLRTLEKRQANHLFWSPKGRFIVLAGFGQMNGMLEFYNVEDLESMRTDQHMMMTDLTWDPSGRYIATFTSYWRHQLDNGFTVWSFSGKRLAQVTKDKFYQLLWRPRPPTLLSPEKQKEIEKNLKVYSARYKKQDLARKKAAWEAYRKRREEQRKAFLAFKKQREQERKAEKPMRIKLRGGVDSEDEADWEEHEEEVEELVKEEVEVIESD